MGLEALLTGHLLCDRYRVGRLIGRGGMGAVYGATDERLEREVAVKVITAATMDVAARQRLRARFHREARAAARLQHPNVATVHDYGTDPRLDLDFLVMELLRGEDLGARLARLGAAPCSLALEILEQAARGVAAGHRTGLVHRDLKPANLYLVDQAQGSPRVCVLDFGIVQLGAEDEGATMTQLTIAGRSPHSPAYAAPEQLFGEDALGPECDVWGLGATGFHLLTGERPFSEGALRRMLAGTPLPAPSARALSPSVPAALDDALRIALAYRPADRFRDAAEFADALAGARRSLPDGNTAAAWGGPSERRAAGGGGFATAADSTLLDDSAGATGIDSARRARRDRWGHAPRWPTSPPPRDVTLLDERPSPALAGPVAVDWPEVTALEPLPPEAASDATAFAQETVPPRRRGWLRRATAALWRAAVTAAAVALTATFGYGMYIAFQNNLTESFYAAVAGLTASLPWALHRLFGRRGRYGLAVLANVAVAFAIFRLLSPVTGPHVAVIALPVAQLLVSAWVLRVTRRREEEVGGGEG